MHQVWRWLECLFALLALTLLTLACHAMWPDKEGAAAWFQAVGSIAAIGVAVYVPWRQRRDEEQRLLAEERRSRLGVARRLYFVSSEFVRACDRFYQDVVMEGHNSHALANLRVADLHGVIEATRALEAQDRDYVATPLLYSIRSQAELMLTKVNRVGRNSGEAHDFLVASAKWREHAMSFQSAADQIKAHATLQAMECGVGD